MKQQCFVCEKPLNRTEKSSAKNGVVFSADGQFDSQIWRKKLFSDSQLLIVICDECLSRHSGSIEVTNGKLQTLKQWMKKYGTD